MDLRRNAHSRVRAAWNVLRGKPTVYGLRGGTLHFSDEEMSANNGLLAQACEDVDFRLPRSTVVHTDNHSPGSRDYRVPPGIEWPSES